MAQKLKQQIKEVGSKLERLPTNKEALIKLLKQAVTCLSELDQSPPKSMLESMKPFLDAVVKQELLKHQDGEVKLLVATCLCDITRITAPEAPYGDDVLKDIFHLIVSTFSGLSDTISPAFGRRVFILETLARYRSCVVMLDLECHDLVKEMFRTFFSVARDDHPDSVITSMQTIMVILLEESEQIQEDLLLVLLSVLGQRKSDVTVAARRLAMSVIEHCAEKLEPGVTQLLISSMSADRSLNKKIEYSEIIYDICHCAPPILSGVIPYLTGELKKDRLDIRLKAIKLVGELFAPPESGISEIFQPIFSEFLKRLTDGVAEVRISALEHIRIILLSNPYRVEAPQIISALCDRLLDYDENVRKQVVAVVCDAACHSLNSIPVETIKLVAGRLHDKSVCVKKYCMERLAEIYRLYCLRCSDGSIKIDNYDWILGKILGCFYDKDLSGDIIEPILCEALFPTEFSIKNKVGNWVRVFSRFDKDEVKALEKILEQKQRLQQEMQRYLSLRKMYKDDDAPPELQKKAVSCFRIMSQCFIDPAKAEENFQILDQLTDADVWVILTNLLDPNTTGLQTCGLRDDLLKILGEKHRLYQFLSTLSVKCSYLLFSKEHVREVLLEAEMLKSTGSTQLTISCMNLLAILAHFSPLLLSGIEENLVHLLEDESEVIKEGVLNVLAKAGGTIREQLGVSSRSLDLMLERICLEGSRRQAKYAVHALAAIMKDDGLMSLSILYKRLVDMLEEKTNLPAVLQSLGCIAQTALPVFETRESEIEGFINRNILECSNKVGDKEKERWEDRSEICSLKIFGIKTLVKSYLPIKDAHLRLGIDGLLGILKNILSFGEISKGIESSSVDKAHLRLAAAKAVLRISKHWDHKIPIDVFYLTLRISEISFPQAKKMFLNKVHQYVRDQLLDPKYACAFLVNMAGSQQPDFEEDKHNVSDIVQMCRLGKARQPSFQCDANSSIIYPEYILPHLVHALVHHSSCPNVECKDVQAFEPIYRRLYLFLSILMHRDEEDKSGDSINVEKESISLMISIFQTIKHSEDIVDSAKSKSSHAICDLGLSITKRLARKEDDCHGSIAFVALPTMLYRLQGSKSGDELQVGEGQTWLADNSVLTHFESLNVDINGTVHSENSKEELPKEGETDGNEVPLGRMIKRLKAKGMKSRKVVKNESLLAGTENENDNDVDILKMVREINLDNLGISSKFESSNGHELSKTESEHKPEKRKREMASVPANVPVPKRRRSLSVHIGFRPSVSKSTSKSSMTPSADNLPQTGSDSLIHKSKNFDDGEDIEAVRGEETNDHDLKNACELMETNNVKTIGNSKIPVGSTKKRKRRSIAVLAKCTTKEGETMDLIGCRIKVWWPLDKTFYEGLVKSYDPQRKKHVILYDDGDVEVLCLTKERWELIENDQKPVKQLKQSKGPPAKGRELNNNFLDSSPQIKKSIKISSSSKERGKRPPKKNLKNRPKGVPKSKRTEFYETEHRHSPDMSDPEPPVLSKVDDIDAGDPEGEWAGRREKSTDEEEQEKNEINVSKKEQMGDVENSPSETEEYKEGKSNSERIRNQDVAGPSHDAQGPNKELGSQSEEKQQSDVSREAFRESGNEEDDVKSQPKDQDVPDRKAAASNTDAEISDDEPLSTWKTAKSVQGK